MIFYFSTPIRRPEGYLLCLRLSNITIPVSWSLVNEDNDSLVIDDAVYTITHGNYSASQLVDEINDTLTQAETPITMAYDSIRYKFTFTGSENFTISGQSTCLEILGFTSNDHPSEDLYLESDAVINLSGAVNILYVDIPNIACGNISGIRGTKTSIIKSIPVSATHGDILLWENHSNSYVSLWNDYLTFFHVRLMDESMNNLIRMNYQHWNMTLEVFFQKYDGSLKSENFSSIINRYVQQQATANANDESS